MYDVLDLIKPKRLAEDKRAILSKDFIALDFSDTLIYKPCETKFPLCEISIKDLYSSNFDEANEINDFTFKLPELEYTEISINAGDVAVLSSISAAGEDIFFCGYIGFRMNLLSFLTSGLVYYNEYRITKEIIPMRNIDNQWIDYSVYYYLFQMFKNLSGKKTDLLLVAKKDDKLYLTNKDKDFYIISKEPSKFKTDSFASINKFYTEQKFGKETAIIKKEWIEGKDSFIKHLIRPLDDVCMTKDSPSVIKLSSNGYELFINKEKQ
jgi:hypothetical protein